MPFLTVDPTNTDQLRAWDGDGGAFWTAHARRFDEGVAAYQGPLIDAAAIGATDTVLDVGCGNGQVTRDCARRGASALGVDLSRSMLEYARHRAGQEQLDNALFVHADAQTHPFTPASFDVAVSRHGSMFFGDPGAAFANIARALRPGGRLVLLTWQPLEHQEWLRAFRSAMAAGRDLPPIPTTGPGPLSLRSRPGAEPAHLRRVRGRAAHGAGRALYYGVDTDDAFRFVAAQQAGLVRDLDGERRRRALDALRDDLAAHETGRGVLYNSATWLVQASVLRRSGLG